VFSFDTATKLIQFLPVAGIDWRERRLIIRLYVDKSIKLKLDQGKTRRVKSRRGVGQRCCLSPIPFNSTVNTLPKEALEGFVDFKVGGKVIRAVKYADDLVLLAKEEAVLQGMIERLI
jgi:hypothetical protein